MTATKDLGAPTMTGTNGTRPKIIDIGAGNRKDEGYTTIDIVDYFKPDIIAEICDLPFEDGTVDGARCLHVLEHLERKDLIPAMNEVWRVLKPGGEFVIEVPIFPYWEAIADPTHVSFFVPQTFWYFTKKDSAMHRKLYGIKPWKMEAARRNALGSILNVTLSKVEAE